MRKLILKLIELYQCTLSPDHGPLKALYPYGFCRHSPTCSEYAKEVIERHGIVLGILLTCKQLLCCNPWCTPTRIQSIPNARSTASASSGLLT